MILKKVEDGVVVSAVEIISFDVQTEDRKATIKVVLNDAQNSEETYYQSPGDKHVFQIVDENNDILRIIHQ
ncbi:hypothetical protein PGH07_04390 [Sulfurovum sp. zt1-1]|uniref:Uncharacterized protein n=1 Tax=Sulfurovum zhangzhouensis TaxID=3019067 RepID=A0ABT7QX55_9BACT|nr:hypothetical protein [Sulfurovum zhangzhouensis]MDM5271407.1 hypothetical protein [Sulfurovum zhangzhouensis]